MQNHRNNQHPVKHLHDVVFSEWNPTYSEPWHILKPWYIQNPIKYIRWSILLEPLSIAYLDSWYIQNLSIFRTQDIQYWESLKYSLNRTMFNLDIFTTLVYLSPNILRAQGKLRNLSNIYDGLFSTEPCVTLVCSELKVYSGLCQISIMEIFIHDIE